MMKLRSSRSCVLSISRSCRAYERFTRRTWHCATPSTRDCSAGWRNSSARWRSSRRESADRGREVRAGLGVEACVEVVGEEQARAGLHLLEERAAPGAEGGVGDVLVLDADRGVVGIEGGGLGAEDRG